MYSNKRHCLRVRGFLFSIVLTTFLQFPLIAQNQEDSIKTVSLTEVIVTATQNKEIIAPPKSCRAKNSKPLILSP